MIKKQILTAVAVLAFGITSQAAFINGSGQFSGQTVLSAANDFTPAGLAGADQVDISTSAIITGESGDFAPFLTPFSTSFSIPAFQFDPSIYINQILNSFGGFSADLIQWDSLVQGPTSISLVGDAVFYGNGFQPTFGQVSLSYTKVEISDEVSFSGTFAAFGSDEGLPDAGGTVALLGIAVTGLALLPRRKTA